jgi:hypothetical protein
MVTMPKITIVCGPPCAGKNHYIDEHRSPDDVVIDWDVIAQELGSPRAHHHPKPMYSRIAAAYDARLAQLEKNPPDHDVWIIRALPEQAERDRWAARFGAEVVLLTPPMNVLLQRARLRDHTSWHEWGIRRWFDRAAGHGPAVTPTAGADPSPTPTTAW